jgi:hypothetical protein
MSGFRAAIQGRALSGGKKRRFRAGLGVRPPGLRMDIFHPASGETLLSFGLAGERLRAVWPQEGVCLDEPATVDTVDWLLGFRVAPGELLPLLTGHLYRDEAIRIEAVSYPPMAVAAEGGPAPTARDRLVVKGVDSVSGARYEGELLAKRGGLALRGRRRAADGSEIVVEYPRWVSDSAGQAGYPEVVRLRAPARRLRVELRLRERAPGGPPEAALLPPLPPGCRRIQPEADSPPIWLPRREGGR